MLPDTNYVAFDSENGVWHTSLPESLCNSKAVFETLWQLHPAEYPVIFLHGREVKLPRWQQAYGHDYHFSGKASKAKPVPNILMPYLDWARRNIDHRLNGMLLNWYDADFGHYIGAHRDSEQGLIATSNIIMISLGEKRITRFRPVKGRGYYDVEVDNGGVVVMNLTTNQHYKHEVPKFKRYNGRRISITLRSFAATINK